MYYQNHFKQFKKADFDDKELDALQLWKRTNCGKMGKSRDKR